MAAPAVLPCFAMELIFIANYGASINWRILMKHLIFFLACLTFGSAASIAQVYVGADGVRVGNDISVDDRGVRVGNDISVDDSGVRVGGIQVDQRPARQPAASVPAARSFVSASLRGMSFEGQNLQGATFTSADLTDMNFKNANLQGADFTSTDLTGVNFQNADLRGASFTSASFLNCDLRGALVTGASFNSVDFTGTLVAGVDFSSAEMVSADLSQAIFTDMAPVPAQNIQIALTDRKAGSLNLAILFDFDKDTLTEDGWRQLTELGNALRSSALSGARIRIEGHTDAKGGDDYNLDLSYRRALRVMRTLSEQFGLDSALLEVKGYGETRPVASNETEAGRAQNRRVTVINTSLTGK